MKNKFYAAIGRAAKVTGVPAQDIIANFKNVAAAPKGVKRATILAHKIYNNYKAPATEAEPTAPEAETKA